MVLAAGVGGLLVLGTQRLVMQGRGAPTDLAPADVLATVDGQPISVQAFEREMVRRSGGAVGIFASPERRRALLDEMIRFQVLLASARQAGYEHDPEVRADAERALAGKFRAEHIDPRLADVSVSDDEVERYFRAHLADYTTPASAHAAVLYFAWTPTTPEERRRTITERAEAARVAALAQTEPTFGPLAVGSDDQATRYVGGDIGWVVAGQKDSRWEPAVLDSIFALSQPRELAPPLITTRGIYVIKLVEAKKPAAARPLDEVRPVIEQQLVAEKRLRLADQLYAEAQRRLRVEVNEARLQAIEVPRDAVAQQEDKPPALPPG